MTTNKMDFNIKSKVISIIKLLDELEGYDNGLSEKLSEVDQKICDLMHLIEYNKLNTGQCYRVIRELHKLRIERRKIKNDFEIMKTYNLHKNKLLQIDNRKILLSYIGKVEKELLNSKYNNRVFTEEEIKELLRN